MAIQSRNNMANPKKLGDSLAVLRGVNKVYGRGERATQALRDIQLQVRAGEFVALLGPSGCGKSTLLRIIAGLIRASDGEVNYRGKPLEGVNYNTSIVFQAFALFPWLTVQENVEVALRPLGLNPLQITKRALNLLDRVGLDGFELAYPRELSGGMRQKVGIARAIAVEPELLCLDEPFSTLDVLSAESLRNELMELWISGSLPTKAILMVSHNIEESVLMADRVIVLDKAPGHVIGDIPINLPHPRRRKDRAFLNVVDQIYAIVVGKTKTEAEELGSAPGEPGKTRALPHAPINAISGLLERLNEEPGGRVDIYKLADELVDSFEDILPIIEAAELLGFARVETGDLRLTTLGQTFADAGIQARKAIFSARIRRVPIIRWINDMLRASDDRRLSWNIFATALNFEFSDEEAERQIDTAVNWARYAETFSYDNADNSLFIEYQRPPVAEPADDVPARPSSEPQ
jgi:NitT/TauT family transport system ATP-binding protein